MITIPSKRLDSRQSQIFQCTVAADFDIGINAFAFHYFGADHNGSFLREWHWGGHAYFSISAVRQVNRSARPIHPPGHGESSARKILVQLSLSRLDHWLPRGQAHPKVMQSTADFHHH